jgi:hypothetical protein
LNIDQIPSPSSDKRHLRSHDGHELNIGVEWQAGHVQDGAGGVFHIHSRFDGGFAIGLKYSAFHSFRERRCGITDIDLAARDV